MRLPTLFEISGKKMAGFHEFSEQNQHDLGADQEVAAVLGGRCLGEYHVL